MQFKISTAHKIEVLSFESCKEVCEQGGKVGTVDAEVRLASVKLGFMVV